MEEDEDDETNDKTEDETLIDAVPFNSDFTCVDLDDFTPNVRTAAMEGLVCN